jgi:hypothetical protein
MSAATAEPVNAAMAVRAIAIFFIFKFPWCKSVDLIASKHVSDDSRNPVTELYAVPAKMLLRREHTGLLKAARR